MADQNPLSSMRAVGNVNLISVLGEETIVIGRNLIDYIWSDLFNNLAHSSVYVLVTDFNLNKIYAPKFVESFNRAADIKFKDQSNKPKLLVIPVPPGESSKKRSSKEVIEDKMLAESCTRDTFVLALGGGVIGDLAGFVAATFMRGVRYAQIPTSLLAMVDSSIGGKTAIDTTHGKNLIGSFWQPKRIFMDLDFLKTLPDREFSNGMAEVIKSAAIWSEEEFVILEKNSDKIKMSLSSDGDKESHDLLLRVVSSSVRMKAHVVTVDERESGLRGLLNFGHTLGHALEAIVAPHILHGECVSIGCVLEAELSHRLGHLTYSAVARLSRCFSLYNLPIEVFDQKVIKLISARNKAEITLEKMMDTMKVDKKNIGTNKRIVLITRIGKTLEDKPTPVNDDVIMEILAPSVEVIAVPENSLDSWKASHGKDGVVLSPPGSKSISNRALVLAALGKGKCRIHNLLHSDDTRVMIEALTALGACKVDSENDGSILIVEGLGGKMQSTTQQIYLGNAGTAARFLTTMVNLASVGTSEYSIVTGNARMRQRPIGSLVEALTENGCSIQYMENEGSLPLKIEHSASKFPGGHIKLAASISSQYVSSILMCAPYATNPVTLELIGDHVISQSYIDMTISMMASFGLNVERLASNKYYIPAGVYSNPADYEIESDASSATYPLAIAAITSTKVTIPNIGFNSLQGDAKFAVDVLRPMGCTVIQTETSTTVQGPAFGTLKPLKEIDMEPMTDAFLTATVLASVATSSDPETGNWTKIRGIANQHVKECDRIEAMSTELAKLGIKCVIHEDGIDIEGQDIRKVISNNPKPYIYCYDDHRVAMSFSVLATAVSPGLIITERRCVGKTWPQWWCELTRNFHINFKGADVPIDGHLYKPAAKKAQAPVKKESKSVVLVGMRGVGKSTLGLEVAKKLGFSFIDMDSYLEEQLSKSIPEVISEEGWESFRDYESKYLCSVINGKHNSNTIIACGGGVVESEESIKTLNKFKTSGGIILHLYADINHVDDYLQRDKTRPAYKTGEPPKEVFNRRLPLYESVANYTLFVHSEPLFGWPQMVQDAYRLISFVSCGKFNKVKYELDRSFFLSLTVSDIGKLSEPQVKELTSGCNAIEVRVDLFLKTRQFEGVDLTDESKFAEFKLFVLKQISYLRRRSQLPLIYTVRSIDQGGCFQWLPEQIESLLKCGIKWGCEYIDVELTLDERKIAGLRSMKNNALIIASYHDITGLKLRWQMVHPDITTPKYYNLGLQYGDIIKFVSVALEWDDNLRCFLFVRRSGACSNKPLIAINMGLTGQYSRVMNPFLTPVTHPALPNSAAPGQLSVAEIQRTLSTLGGIPPLKFCLLGDPISASPSPIMHNSGFESLGFPYKYFLYPINIEKTDSDNPLLVKLTEFLRSSEFGGASVTIPNKQSIIKYMDELTPAAKIIGAVNTVIPSKANQSVQFISPASSYFINPNKVRLVGDNTDYLGIMRSISRANQSSLSPQSIGSNTKALVIGAGGTSRAALYALYSMGLENVYLYNRTKSRADDLAAVFNDILPKLEVITTLDQKKSSVDNKDLDYSIIISTVPASDLQFEFPDSLFGAAPITNKESESSLAEEFSKVSISKSNYSKIALDMAYKPKITPLLEKSATFGWVTVSGFQVLVDQGIEQFERWTHVSAPEPVMNAAVINFMQSS
ncbi:Pentafunctional AROM polypeptide [Smittium culicis]|uniref:Pentafunctional AROM polypeptide n=1 Tax=Smittium culicis TaxID=133412 RepID=A0A1R1Y4T0_9FUNG|nr:Pentafunctional AROM polypeptide [Smittium culicis]OMJ29377.1 Pentafunctional AROM polypeptide [Smittium culicis]